MTLYTAVAGFGRDPFSSDDGLMMDCHPTITYHQCAAAGQKERERGKEHKFSTKEDKSYLFSSTRTFHAAGRAIHFWEPSTF